MNWKNKYGLLLDPAQLLILCHNVLKHSLKFLDPRQRSALPRYAAREGGFQRVEWAFWFIKPEDVLTRELGALEASSAQR